MSRYILAGVLVIGALAACGGALGSLDSANNAQDDVTLAACRDRARAAEDAGADASAAWNAYEQCKAEAGL